jgi:uncharacterized integral membrane protein
MRDKYLAMTGERVLYRVIMPEQPSPEVLNSLSGIPSGRRHDAAYRAGMVLQVLGAGTLAVLYPLESPYWSAGIMLFDVGVLLSAVCLLVWISWIRRIILGAVLIGIPLQVIGLQLAPPQHAGSVILAGIGLVCASAAGMAGKEAYCFAYREGWVLMWTFPAVMLANIAAGAGRIVNSLAFSGIFLLLLSLTGRKLQQPLLPKCPAAADGPPSA